MVKIIGTLAAVHSHHGEQALVIQHPRHNGVIIREHINLRFRDFANDARVDNLRIGDIVTVSGELGSYFDNGKTKACISNIVSVKKI